MPHSSRRHFLKQSALLATGAAAWAHSRSLWPFPSGPALKFPKAPRARLAVASWPFRDFIVSPNNRWARHPHKPGMDLKDFAALVVKRFGLHLIEPLGDHFRSTDATYLRELRESTEKAGARIVDIPVGVPHSFYDPNRAGREKAVATGRQWVDIAVAVGSPSVRLHIAGVPNVPPDAVRAAESLKRVAAYGAKKNVLVNLENDDNYTEDPFFIVQVIERVANPYLRALPDFCNSMLTHDQAFNDRAMEAMFKHAYNIAHMKDSEVGEGGKVYTVDVARCFEIAKASGYRGYFSMEWEGAGEPFAGTQKLIDESLKYLA
jgi:sugar phosphate isomerase/epimerase